MPKLTPSDMVKIYMEFDAFSSSVQKALSDFRQKLLSEMPPECFKSRKNVEYISPLESKKKRRGAR